MCEDGGEVPAGRLSAYEEAFVEVRFEELSVLDDLEMEDGNQEEKSYTQGR